MHVVGVCGWVIFGILWGGSKVFKFIDNKKWVGMLIGLVVLLHDTGVVRSENNYWSERAAQRRDNGFFSVDNSTANSQDTSGDSFRSPDIAKTTQFPLSSDRSVWDSIGHFGTLRPGSALDRPDGPWIFLIRDIHGNASAQNNIAAAIAALAQNQGVSLVGLEGATGPFLTDEFSAYPDRSIVDRVGVHFLNNNRISGAEFAGLSLSASPRRLTLWGVDSPRLYHANVLAAKESIAQRESAREVFRSIDGAIALEKRRLYSPPLVAFDDNQRLFDLNKIDLDVYLSKLVGWVPQWEGDAYPNVDLLLRSFRVEKQLDGLQLKREQIALAEELGKDEQGRIRQDRGAKGGGGPVDKNWAATVKDLMEKAGIDCEKYPGIMARIRLSEEVQRLDNEQLLDEIDRLAESVQSGLAQTQEQKILVQMDQDVRLLGRLFRLEMTPADWVKYNQRREKIGEVPGRLHLKIDLVERVRPFESFWAWAQRRDKALAFNLLKKMRSSGEKSAVLVAGGFHTDGVAAILAEAGVAVTVMTPNASITVEDRNYIDLFAKDPPALRELVNGQQVALKTQCPLAARADTDSVRRALHIFIAGLTAWGRFKAERAGSSVQESLDKLRNFIEGWPFQPELVGVAEDGIEINLGGDRARVEESNNGPILTLMSSNGNKNGGGSSTGNGRKNNEVSWKWRLWVMVRNFILEEQIPIDPQKEERARRINQVSDRLVVAYQAGTLNQYGKLLDGLNLTNDMLDEVANDTLKKLINGKKASRVSNHPLSGEFVVLRFEGLEGVIGVLPKNNTLPVAVEFNKHYLDIKGSLKNLFVPSSLVYNPDPFLLGNKSIVRTSLLLMKDFTQEARPNEERFFPLTSDSYWPSKAVLTTAGDSISKIGQARTNKKNIFSESLHYLGWEPSGYGLSEKALGVLEPRAGTRDVVEPHLVLFNPLAIQRRQPSPPSQRDPNRIPDVFSSEIEKAQRALIADRINRKSASPVTEAKPGEIPNLLQQEMKRLRRIAAQL